MKINKAIDALSSLAQETRLLVFRLLVKSGPEGLAAGQIATKLELSAPTLSFHLKELKSAGLIDCTRRSRSLIYTANFKGMRMLVEFLTEDCCGGQPTVCGLPTDPKKTTGKEKAA